MSGQPRKQVNNLNGGKPLFWDSKLYGKPYGDFYGGSPEAPAAAAGGRAQPHHNRAVQDNRGRPSSGNRQSSPTLHRQPKLAQLEENMRKQLTARSKLHETERIVLLRAFAKVLRVPRIAVQQKVAVEQFINLWHSLGVELSKADTETLFNKYGRDRDGKMPVMVYVEGVLLGDSRYLAKRSDKAVNKNPFQKDMKGGEAANFAGEILYPQCRKGVFAPTTWDPKLAERSATLPDVELSLEFVYGYNGLFNTAPNLFYVNEDEVIYYTAAVGIKYNKRHNTQQFFLQHSDDIHCIAYSAVRGLAATGQVGPVGRNVPKVCIWEPCPASAGNGGQPQPTPADPAAQMPQKLVLEFPKADRGITAVAFSPCGNRIATVAMDNAHTMYIWNVGRGAKAVQRQGEDSGDALAVCKTANGAPPATHGVAWNPFDDSTLLTYGLKNIKFYSLTEERKGSYALKGYAGQFGSQTGVKKPAGTAAATKVHTVTAAAFLSATAAVTGNADGEICLWKKMKSGFWHLKQRVKAHKTGSKERCVDGSMGYSGVRVLRLRADGLTLLSGGADGMVMLWSVTSGFLDGPPIKVMPVVLPSQLQDGEEMPKIRALDCMPGSDVFMVGTRGCDIFEVDEDPEMLIEGHSADVYGLAMSPTHPHIFATACESTKVGVWDSSRRRNLRLVEIGRIARSVAWSPDGMQLAVGCRDGGVKVLEFHPAMRQVFWAQAANSAIDEIKFSPCGRYLAAASHDQAIDIFDASNGYAKVGRCVGHSSTVNHLDWSQDSRVIKSTDTARELLYFNPRTCKQVKENQRDTIWTSWTTAQGFPVMGIWKNTSDTTDINACDRSPCGRYLAAVDDSGMTRLYNYPCVVEKAPSRDYSGHSSHVLNARFSSDGKHLVTVGGHDRAVFQWTIKREVVKAPPPLVAPWVHQGGNQWGPDATAAPPVAPAPQQSRYNSGGRDPYHQNEYHQDHRRRDDAHQSVHGDHYRREERHDDRHRREDRSGNHHHHRDPYHQNDYHHDHGRQDYAHQPVHGNHYHREERHDDRHRREDRNGNHHHHRHHEGRRDHREGSGGPREAWDDHRTGDAAPPRGHHHGYGQSPQDHSHQHSRNHGYGQSPQDLSRQHSRNTSQISQIQFG